MSRFKPKSTDIKGISFSLILPFALKRFMILSGGVKKIPPKIGPTRQRNYMVLMMWMPLPYHLHLARTGWRILQNMARVLHPAIQFSNSAPDVCLKSFLKFVGGPLSIFFLTAILYLWKDVRFRWNKRTITYCRCIVKYHFSIMPEGSPNKRIQVCYIGLASL